MRSLWDRVKGLPIPDPAPVEMVGKPAVPSGAEMTDTEILDWIEKYVESYFPYGDGQVHIKFKVLIDGDKNDNRKISGEYKARNLRQAVMEVNQKVVLK